MLLIYQLIFECESQNENLSVSPVGGLLTTPSGNSFFLFKHIYHCFPQKHLGLTRGIKILQIYNQFIQAYSQTDT